MALRLTALAALAALALGAGLAFAAGPVRVPEYGVFERAIEASGAREDVTLTGPAGRRIEIGGFAAGDGTWRFGFAPSALGTWTWRARVTGGGHAVTRMVRSSRCAAPRPASSVAARTTAIAGRS